MLLTSGSISFVFQENVFRFSKAYLSHSGLYMNRTLNDIQIAE